MPQVPVWHASGDWFDVCSCSIPCPCEFAQPPTNNRCSGMLAWHIRAGRYGTVGLDGLNVLAVGEFEGNIWSGTTKAAMGFWLDDRADALQEEALRAIFGGQAGGWPAGFANLIGDLRGIETAPIQFSLEDDLASWQAAVPGRVRGSAEALSGPTTPPGTRVRLHNPPGSEVGPGGVATWGRGTELSIDAFGVKLELSGCSSKHIPFEWHGPDR